MPTLVNNHTKNRVYFSREMNCWPFFHLRSKFCTCSLASTNSVTQICTPLAMIKCYLKNNQNNDIEYLCHCIFSSVSSLIHLVKNYKWVNRMSWAYGSGLPFSDVERQSILNQDLQEKRSQNLPGWVVNSFNSWFGNRKSNISVWDLKSIKIKN